jgi:transposase
METMEKQRRPRRSFSRELKAEVVEVVRQPGNTVGSLSRDFELTETAVREWMHQADVGSGRRDGLTGAEREELSRLRKENRVLREEHDILKRCDGFCREGDPVSCTRSSKRSRLRAWVQPVEATLAGPSDCRRASSASAGVRQPSVFRGRPLRVNATASRSSRSQR